MTVESDKSNPLLIICLSSRHTEAVQPDASLGQGGQGAQLLPGPRAAHPAAPGQPAVGVDGRAGQPDGSHHCPPAGEVGTGGMSHLRGRREGALLFSDCVKGYDRRCFTVNHLTVYCTMI